MQKKYKVIGVILIACFLLFFGYRVGKNVTMEKMQNMNATQETKEEPEEKPSKKKESGAKDEISEKDDANENVAISIQATNRWEENGNQMVQIDGKLQNTSADDVTDWKVKVEVPSGASVSQGWNADYKIEGNQLIAKPVDYNQVISAGQTVEFGLILATKEEFDPKSYQLFLNGTEQAAADDRSQETMQEETKEEKEETTDTAKEDGKENTNQDNLVNAHGALSVEGTNLVDEKGDSFVLKGVSTHGIAWFPEYINEEAFLSLRDEFGVNTIRLAMYSNPNDGYNKSLHAKVKEGVELATKLSMYVIIDWHILNDNNPNIYKKEAIAFFEEMTDSFKDYNNVLYEICNEPNGDTKWEEDIKPYAKDLVESIRKKSDAIIIIGTPNWSQDVDVVAKSPLQGYDNLMYAVHFYAATHKDDLRNKVKEALNQNLPVFVSEFSICDASGNGALDKSSADAWFRLIDENKLSYVTWNLSNKNESSSILKPDCKKKGGFTKEDLSEAGAYILLR